ncbi:uncharacterized protein Tco025E_03490 [Trypanosoma conorhini]|uniref:Uncharacterized protein n=1 Tax=Trypanosoma conorhini TaxID=83891 RepID=A0A422PV96_9TRYP|nr:uncharacterized protein Tco025E_03490 [Trypanosoma conorhini]RNF21709.1 hypothetical protein Tco025E_03490 [Trypanosoma conorhini]
MAAPSQGSVSATVVGPIPAGPCITCAGDGQLHAPLLWRPQRRAEERSSVCGHHGSPSLPQPALVTGAFFSPPGITFDGFAAVGPSCTLAAAAFRLAGAELR